jgi:hypothetical protein
VKEDSPVAWIFRARNDESANQSFVHSLQATINAFPDLSFRARAAIPVSKLNSLV